MVYTTPDISGSTSLILYPSACNGCGRCMVICPRGVFSTANGRAMIIDRGACDECGACMMECPVSAIAVIPDEPVMIHRVNTITAA